MNMVGLQNAYTTLSMKCGVVVFLGNLPTKCVPLDKLALEFGWLLETTVGINDLRNISDPVAVLFHPRELGLSWDTALRSVLDAAPDALPIVCHAPSDVIDWPQLASAGAYHSLLLPLDPSELRQSFGFVQAAARRSWVPLDRLARPVARVPVLTWSAAGCKGNFGRSQPAPASPLLRSCGALLMDRIVGQDCR